MKTLPVTAIIMLVDIVVQATLTIALYRGLLNLPQGLSAQITLGYSLSNS